jgi:hypothetical protein
MHCLQPLPLVSVATVCTVCCCAVSPNTACRVGHLLLPCLTSLPPGEPASCLGMPHAGTAHFRGCRVHSGRQPLLLLLLLLLPPAASPAAAALHWPAGNTTQHVCAASVGICPTTELCDLLDSQTVNNDGRAVYRQRNWLQGSKWCSCTVHALHQQPDSEPAANRAPSSASAPLPIHYSPTHLQARHQCVQQLACVG